MSTLPTVALVGATGNLGPAILKKLLDAGFPVRVLTRQGSTSTSSLAPHPNQTIEEVDYSSKPSIIAALSGANAVVSTLGGTSIADQHRLIDAAVETGTVTRFVPSDFGSDIFHPLNVDLPVYASKIDTAKYLEKVAEAHPSFSWTSIMNNAFWDWGMTANFLINVQGHTATLWDGGDVPFSVTRLSTVGDAVVGIMNNLEATKNKSIKIHEAVVTQNQLISYIKQVDGKEWQTTVKSTKQEEADSYAELKKPNGNIGKAMMGFLAAAIWGEGRDVFASQVENDLLGIKEVTSAQAEEITKAVFKGQAV